MATPQAKAHNNARQSQRRRSREKPSVVGDHTRARLQKTKSMQDHIFHSVPVRDEDWSEIPLADADVSDAELESAKEKAIHAMTEWGVLVESSRASGIGRHTLYRMMKADPVFRLRMTAARKNNDERIEREMRRRGQIKGGELAAIFVMKHNIKRYREIQRVELTGKGGAPVAYIDAKAELLKRLEALALKSKGTEAIAVGEKPRLLKGGSDGEGVEVKRVSKGEGWKAQSKR